MTELIAELEEHYNALSKELLLVQRKRFIENRWRDKRIHYKQESYYWSICQQTKNIPRSNGTLSTKTWNWYSTKRSICNRNISLLCCLQQNLCFLLRIWKNCLMKRVRYMLPRSYRNIALLLAVLNCSWFKTISSWSNFCSPQDSLYLVIKRGWISCNYFSVLFFLFREIFVNCLTEWKYESVFEEMIQDLSTFISTWPSFCAVYSGNVLEVKNQECVGWNDSLDDDYDNENSNLSGIEKFCNTLGIDFNCLTNLSVIPFTQTLDSHSKFLLDCQKLFSSSSECIKYAPKKKLKFLLIFPREMEICFCCWLKRETFW